MPKGDCFKKKLTWNVALTKASAEIFEQEAILIIHDHENAVQPIANVSSKGTKTSWGIGMQMDPQRN